MTENRLKRVIIDYDSLELFFIVNQTQHIVEGLPENSKLVRIHVADSKNNSTQEL